MVRDGCDQRLVGFERTRLQTQQSDRAMALLLVVVLVPAVLVVAISTLARANSSVNLQIIDDFVGLWARNEPEHRLLGARPATAPQCSSTQDATFTGEFVALAQKIGDAIGHPIECPHVDPSTSDVLQATSTGLAAYRANSHLATFTDGYHHWALDGQRMITWEGDGVDPTE